MARQRLEILMYRSVDLKADWCSAAHFAIGCGELLVNRRYCNVEVFFSFRIFVIHG